MVTNPIGVYVPYSEVFPNSPDDFQTFNRLLKTSHFRHGK